MEETYVLTIEDFQNARDYVPFNEKEAFVKDVSVMVFDTLNIEAAFDIGGGGAMPPMYKENTSAKMRCMLCALLKMWFGKEVETDDGSEWLMSIEAYDNWASHHIINQIERMKQAGDKAVKDKCFDILQDYKELEKRLNTEVYGMLSVMNDPVTRAASYITELLTPETIQRNLESIKQSSEELQEYIKQGQIAEQSE